MVGYSAVHCWDDWHYAVNFDSLVVKNLWAILIDEGHIAFSYQAFRGYVKRLIPLAVTAESNPEKSHSNKTSGKMPEQAATGKKPPAMAGFTFNPIPRKEDLL